MVRRARWFDDGRGVSVMVGRFLSAVGVVCALVGIFVIDGISIEFPGILLGTAGYAFGLSGRDRTSRILGIVAIVLCVLSMVLSGLTGPPQ